MMPTIIRVLLVEDDQDDYVLFADLLREVTRRQHVVDWAPTYDAALRSIAKGNYDVCVVDYRLGAHTGMEILREVCSLGKNLPVILLTGQGDDGVDEEAMRNGAADYLTKDTLTPVMLERTIRHALERRWAAERLLESESRFLAFMGHTPAGAFIKDELGRYLYRNKRFEELLGLKADAHLKTDLDLLPEETARALREADARVLVSGQAATAVEEFTTPAGNRHHWLVSRFPMKDALGSRLLGGVAVEITDRILAEQALATERELLQAVLDNAQAGIAACDAEGRITLFNRVMQEFMGRPPHGVPLAAWCAGLKLLAADGHSPLPPADFPLFRALQGEPLHNFELLVSSASGTTRALLVNGQPITDGDGTRQGAVVVAHDITARRQSEQQIRQQAELLDAATDAILVRDADNRITYWNRGAERLYGWSRDEAQGRAAHELLRISPTDLQALLHTLHQSGDWAGEQRHQTKAGREVTVQSHWTLVRGREGEPASTLCINTDITEKKRIEAQYLRAQRMESIGTLAGGVAHDLNNILAPMLMASQILRMQLGKADCNDLIDSLESSAQRGAKLVKQVLTFARGGTEGEKCEVQLRHLIKEMHRMIREMLPSNIEVRVNHGPDLWAVLGDATQIDQVLMNLCVNARDAMPEGGRLEILAENIAFKPEDLAAHPGAKAGPYVVITVSDSGTGIPPEIQERIFEPFFTTKEHGKGTGLGLATVAGIVKGHGGFLNVYSEVGNGTRFRIYFPAATEPAPAAVPAKATEIPRGNGECILVVDDERPILELVRRTLEAFNYRVLTANDGTVGLSLAIQHHGVLRLVITDMMMPKLEGAALMRAINNLKPDLPFIAVSGLAHNEKTAHAATEGYSAFLAKPFTAEVLLRTVAKALSATRPAAAAATAPAA
ncbi:MAG: PAS/PAC sensor hybrid histidine kinase [Limisphaerales bacterium]|nr:MAG: PAS/PAC sensor hybrid histidine kinase [Limisphaerales bacterium]KAG0509767.1 MAG: PAS/PAC sensor hybrid histidine kinase [Limisphaerales bacterium]TXT51011.1 MAG: PAS/PAC sensor hybrid histidine kinase [Limisphaerales bacterium]